MNIVKRLFYTLLQCTWGILQTLAGACMFLVLIRRRHFIYRGCAATVWKRRDSASVGIFIFISENLGGRLREEVIVHEYGHTVQSVILGPLYPFIISIPSAVWCLSPGLVKMRDEKGISYYSFYTEKWANRLGSKITGETLTLLEQKNTDKRTGANKQ